MYSQQWRSPKARIIDRQRSNVRFFLSNHVGDSTSRLCMSCNTVSDVYILGINRKPNSNDPCDRLLKVHPSILTSYGTFIEPYTSRRLTLYSTRCAKDWNSRVCGSNFVQQARLATCCRSIIGRMPRVRSQTSSSVGRRGVARSSCVDCCRTSFYTSQMSSWSSAAWSMGSGNLLESRTMRLFDDVSPASSTSNLSTVTVTRTLHTLH
jgi:hypothetical protein